MKLSMANFMIQMMTRITLLTLIIVLVVGSLLHGSTTVDAADIEYDPNDPYILAFWIGDSNPEIYISDGDFIFLTQTSNSTSLSARDWPKFVVVDYTYAYRIEYSVDLNQWINAEILEPSYGDGSLTTRYRFGAATAYSSDVGRYIIEDSRYNVLSQWTNVHIASNFQLNDAEISILGSYTNDLSGLPHGITENDVRNIFDEQINTQTSAGQSAQTIINNTTNQYNLYLTGDISSAEMQQNVTDNINALNDLTPSTLLDAMQINNGLTYNQSIQDQLLNTASPALLNEVRYYIQQSQALFNAYRRGERDQEYVMDALSRYNGYLTQGVYNGTYTSTADLELINMAINTINNYTEQVASFKDIAQESSDKSQQSDQAEIDYLDELTAETTATVEQIAPSKNFTSGQTGEAQEVLDLIWENEFVKRLLPMCAGFMVVCVVLGIRYRV